ncbi:MAG TPA: FtsX-like permease family protein, partial [Solirubrobacteraceae bacterium]|nr:FtsX-like permease family protein [Solirubrobacteraceae bacterium]
MKPSNVVRLYRVRLRARLAQECLAVLGIAAGVALLFASQVSSSSLQSSVAALMRGIAGRATLQLLARDPQGFPQSALVRVRAIPGVRTAAPLLEADANASGPQGAESVKLIGADATLAKLGGALVRHVELTPFGGVGAVVLPAPLARAIGVTRFGQEATFQLAGHTATAPLYEQLHARQIGALVGTPIALAPLAFAQELAGVGARVSRILVQPAPGAQARVRAALERIAAGRLNVEPIGYDETLFAKAAAASDQATSLFAAICALVGFLFAFNAMLLTVAQRRRLIADLRRDGYTARTAIAVLTLDAVVLGLIACVLGLALGEELSIHLFHSNPAFLSLAFALGSQRVVGWQSVALAAGGGMAAAVVAVMSPLRDVFSGKEGPDRSRETLAFGSHPRFGQPAFGRLRHPLAGDPLAAIAGSRRKAAINDLPRKTGLDDSPPGKAATRGRLGGGGATPHAGLEREFLPPFAGVACLAGATAILLLAPNAALAGMALLFGALLLELPLALSATLALVTRLAGRITSPVAHVAAMELRGARARAMAIAATGAVAVFGSVAIQGAHGDLLAGLEDAAHDMNAFTDVWVAPAGSY